MMGSTKSLYNNCNLKLFVHRLELGRPPSLHPLKIPTGSLWEEHCVVANFEKDSDQQLSVMAGAKVVVVNKDESGTYDEK